MTNLEQTVEAAPDTGHRSGIAKAPSPETIANARSVDGRPTDEIRELLAAAAHPRVVALEKYSTSGDAKPPQTVSKGTGPFMSVADLHLVFWGAEWISAAPPVDPLAVRVAVGSICNSAYLQAAYGYGDSGSVSWQTSFMQSATEPPAAFQNNAVSNLLTSLFASGAAPLPDSEGDIDQFYVVFMPSTATSNQAGVGGEHTFYTWTNPAAGNQTRVRYAWILNNSSIDFVTAVFSHELVEAYTDPEGTYIQLAPASPTNWNEVADVCTSVGYVDGVAVQSYWSQKDGACVIPYYVDHGFPDETLPNGVRMRVIATRRVYAKSQNVWAISEFRVQAPNGDQYHIRSAVMEAAISKGTNTFYVHGADGTEADVQIYMRPPTGRTYLATVPDGSVEDNLLALPTI